MDTPKRFIAEWYEDDSIDEYEGFMSDILHISSFTTLAAAKLVSKKYAIKHGSMVVGMVTEQEYSPAYGWISVAEYVCEYFDFAWQKWERKAV